MEEERRGGEKREEKGREEGQEDRRGGEGREKEKGKERGREGREDRRGEKRQEGRGGEGRECVLPSSTCKASGPVSFGFLGVVSSSL